jgi:hypothetical protein
MVKYILMFFGGVILVSMVYPVIDALINIGWKKHDSWDIDDEIKYKETLKTLKHQEREKLKRKMNKVKIKRK